MAAYAVKKLILRSDLVAKCPRFSVIALDLLGRIANLGCQGGTQRQSAFDFMSVPISAKQQRFNNPKRIIIGADGFGNG